VTYEKVAAAIEAKEQAKLRAQAIVEVSEDLEAVVKSETGRVISEELTNILDIIHAMKQAIEASPEKNPRAMILKLLGGMHNRLSIISAGYAAGSLPKVGK
jgi:predicted methyltransferase MtxX (methanogen marker protein 4)